MKNYSQYSKDELIQRIEELERQIAAQASEQGPADNGKEAGLGQYQSKDILNILPDMLSVFDRNYNFVALASSEHTVHVGGSSTNLIGKNLFEILPESAYTPIKENFDKVLVTGEPSIGFHNLEVDGKRENFENRVILLGDQQHILCICRNITDSVTTQSQLQMVTRAVDNSQEEIYAIQTDGTIVFANKRFINHYELTDELTSYKIYDVLKEQSREQWDHLVKHLKTSKEATNYTLNYSTNGKEYTQEISAFIIQDNFEEDIIWTIARDITYRIEQEKQIHELNQLMDTILNNIPVYLFVKDTGNDFRYLYWNKEFAQSSQIPADNVIGKTDAEIFPSAQDAEKFRRDDMQILKNKETVDFEEDYISATGEKRTVHTIKTLVPLEGQEPLLIGISWDITEQKRIEQELIEAKNKAEEADKLKSTFLANMSHEIRTPLNAIVGFSKLIAETEEAEERKQFSELVDKNTDLLLQLINDILDLSKIEAGIIEFKEKDISLNELCQGIYETFQPRMSENIRFTHTLPGEDVAARIDSNRLAQVLSNLLNNAKKFTPEGEIRFGYSLHDNLLEFYVQDTGIGIAPENIDKIFNRFTKLNGFIQGSGLGLSICQTLVENMGGKIKVSSELNRGTEFRFTLPRNPVKTPLK